MQSWLQLPRKPAIALMNRPRLFPPLAPPSYRCASVLPRSSYPRTQSIQQAHSHVHAGARIGRVSTTPHPPTLHPPLLENLCRSPRSKRLAAAPRSSSLVRETNSDDGDGDLLLLLVDVVVKDGRNSGD